MNNITLVCSRCKQEKSSDAFGKHPTRGYQFYCKQCMAEYRKTHKAGNGHAKKDLTDVVERECSWCHQVKPASEFWKHATRGVQFYCIECHTWYNTKGVHNGLSPEEYQRQLEGQGGVCACCGKPEIKKRSGRVQALSTDHNHVTGTLRGIVCHACNTAIGAVEKHGTLRAQPERTEMILKYLKRYGR